MAQNIIFFMSDQQRFDSLGCNGQKLPVSPRIDEFAREDATNFTKAYTVQPVCGPLRSCLQTGLYATQTGCYRNAIALPQDMKALGHHMREAGYNVGYVGKWHLATDSNVPDMKAENIQPVPMNKRGGFNDFWMVSDILEMTSHGYDGYVFDKENKRVDFVGYRADCLTDYALDYLTNYDSEKPFFLFISHLEPHQQNDRNNFEAPDGVREKFVNYEKPADLIDGKGDWEQYYPDYLGCCNALDRNFGRIIDLLKDKGIYEDTSIIYTSDHGCHFKTRLDECVENGYDDYKRNSHENTIHIPLLIKGEGFGQGVEEERLVGNISLTKTLLDMADGSIPSEMQGESLVHISKKTDWDNTVYIQISESYVGRMIRTDRYKYVIYDPSKNPWDESAGDRYVERYLYDMENDPFETTNLINDPSYAEKKQGLKLKLLECARKAGEGDLHIMS